MISGMKVLTSVTQDNEKLPHIPLVQEVVKIFIPQRVRSAFEQSKQFSLLIRSLLEKFFDLFVHHKDGISLIIVPHAPSP